MRFRVPIALTVAGLLSMHVSVPDHRARATTMVTECTEAALDAALAGGGTVVLTCTGTITFSEAKVVAAGMSLVVAGSGGELVLSGGAAVQHFLVRAGGSLSLADVTLADGLAGRAFGTGGAVRNSGMLSVRRAVFVNNYTPGGLGIGGGAGGAIFNHTGARAVVEDTVFLRNRASGGGGAIYVEDASTVEIRRSVFRDNAGAGGTAIHNFGGRLTVEDSLFEGNRAISTSGIIGAGGAIRNAFGGHTKIERSLFRQNRSSYLGGAIVNEGPLGDHGASELLITDSTFSENATMDDPSGFGGFWGGGAIFNLGAATIVNSTFFGNATPRFGGAISSPAVNSRSTLTLVHVTVSGNVAQRVGGVFTGGLMTVKNVILADNQGADCAADGTGWELSDGGGNYIEDGSCGFVPRPDPGLGLLAENGGTTPTMRIDRTSPAFGTGDPAVCLEPPPAGAGSRDQRGFGRSSCSPGAFEPFPELPFRQFLSGVAADAAR